MKLKRTFLATTIAVVAAFCVVGAALAASAGLTGGKAKKHAAHVRISAFNRPFHPTAAQRRERAKIARLLHRAPKGAIAATASAGQARPAHVRGIDEDVWISPAASGGVCTYVPDPVDGYAVSCATEADIASGAAVTLLGGGSSGPLKDAAIVAVVVPDGADPPTLKDPDGDLSVVPTESNTAAEVVPLGSTVYSGGIAVGVPQLAAPKCPPPVVGEPTRCKM